MTTTIVTVELDGSVYHTELVEPSELRSRTDYIAGYFGSYPCEVGVYHGVLDRQFHKMPTGSWAQMTRRLSTLYINEQTLIETGVRNGAFTPSSEIPKLADGRVDHASINNRNNYRSWLMACHGEIKLIVEQRVAALAAARARVPFKTLDNWEPEVATT